MKLADILAKHDRVIIAGVPGAGKTYATKGITDRPVIHTDDHKDKAWADAPKAIAESVPSGPVVIEGVRALAATKHLDEPVTCVVWLDRPRKPLNAKQKAMAKGRRTNFARWRAENPDVDVESLED